MKGVFSWIAQTETCYYYLDLVVSSMKASYPSVKLEDPCEKTTDGRVSCLNCLKVKASDGSLKEHELKMSSLFVYEC